MKKLSVLSLMLLSIPSFALTTLSFKDNGDVPIVLSDSNYNRLVVKRDKITQAHFPEGSMNVKNEDDGSLYAIATQKEPFTLFLTTELGHHFSTTVNTESALGKTIEFISQTPIAHPSSVKTPPMNADTIAHLMTAMMSQKPIPDFSVKKHFNRVIRLQQGLILMPKLTYTSPSLIGEVMQIYNRNEIPLPLYESTFMTEGVKTVIFSKQKLNSKERGFVYRVMENRHV